MHRLEARIRNAIAEGRWSFTDHADERIAERGIESWQIIEGVDEGETILIDPMAKPNPKMLIRQMLPDGAAVVAVWAFVKSINSAALITVYFPTK